MKILKIIVCKLGLHSWEKEPSEKQPIIWTSINQWFGDSGQQQAKRNCEHCPATQDVWRKGNTWASGSWKAMSAGDHKHFNDMRADIDRRNQKNESARARRAGETMVLPKFTQRRL